MSEGGRRERKKVRERARVRCRGRTDKLLAVLGTSRHLVSDAGTDGGGGGVRGSLEGCRKGLPENQQGKLGCRRALPEVEKVKRGVACVHSYSGESALCGEEEGRDKRATGRKREREKKEDTRLLPGRRPSAKDATFSSIHGD